MSLDQMRDIALIVLAVLAIIQVIVLLFISFSLYRKIGPLIDSITGTLGNIQGTTAFLAETTVSPVIRVLSFLSGVRAATGKMADVVKRQKGGSDGRER